MDKIPRIHLYIRGNCGNQFFQYAFARHLQEKLGAELIINYSKVANKSSGMMPESDNLLSQFNTVPYKYESNVGFGGLIFKFIKLFHIIFRLNTFEERTYNFYLSLAKWLPKLGIYYFDAAYYPFPVYKQKDIYVNGYFESAQYFNDIDDKIKKELTPKQPLLEQNIDLYRIITESESVCVTIKRMDINNADVADIYQYEMSYFYKAMQYMLDNVINPIFIIFSDDVEWCRKNIKINAKMYFETPCNPIWEKIRLMVACKHFIIHNSTFSWWVQHLSTNPNKVVIAPSKWMLRDDQPIDIYEDGWIYLNPKGELVGNHE